MDRSALNRAATARAEAVVLDEVICFETHKDEQTYPWLIGRVKQAVHTSTAASLPYNAQTDAVRFEPVRWNEPVLGVQIYEALEPGSTTYKLSDLTLLVPARRVRVAKIELEEVRASQIKCC